MLAILGLAADQAFARAGKVFFKDGKWIKGDIQERADELGREIVVVEIKAGSITIPREDVEKVAYSPGSSEVSPLDSKFMKHLKSSKSGSFAEEKKVMAPLLYDNYIREASQIHKLDPNLVKAVIKQESNYNRLDVSRKGAQGLMQIMPDTARKLGVEDAFDPYENIHGGTRYLSMMIENFNGDLTKALAAYNAGPGAVKKYGSVPPYRETQNYVRKVLRYYRLYRGNRLLAFEDPSGRLIFTDQPEAFKK